MFDTMMVERRTTGAVPAGLGEMEPGPVLAGFLASIDVDLVSGYDQIVVLRPHQRMVSHYTAHLYGDMASVSATLARMGTNPVCAAESAAAEIRAALTLPQRAADVEIGSARDLADAKTWVAE